MLYHATTILNLASIRESGLLVSKADPASKIKGVWMCTATNRAWSVLHTIKKHQVALDEVVVIEVHPLTSALVTFGRGFYYSTVDLPPSRLGVVINGQAFGVGVSE